ncbi:hypothetical protein NKH55_08435 [Mesorhizobium opportunistum]|uniref:hypothetical protein n=1 Tax=Mesorhizobium opportunistum TaxID=593909 RepID=UPI00333B4FDE
MVLIRDFPNINAVKVGRFHLKPGSVYETITRSCRMLLREAEGRTLPLWRSGSATLVKHGSINYVIATRHQLGIRAGEVPSEDILHTIRVSSGIGLLSNIVLQRVRFEISNPDEEYHDLLIFEVADLWKTKEADSPYFFPLKRFTNASRRKSFLVGHPSIDGVIDKYHENFSEGAVAEIHIKRSIVDCDYDPNYVSKAEYFRRYLHSKASHVMDGYSGGAVFSLVGELEHLEVVLDGIVVRAGAKHIHTVDVDYLVKIICETK